MFTTIRNLFTPKENEMIGIKSEIANTPINSGNSRDYQSSKIEAEDNNVYVQSLINQAEIEDGDENNIEPIDLMNLAPAENRQLKNSMEKDLKKIEFKGLLVSHEINEFHRQNYFSRGRHNGVNFGDEGTLELGLTNITSDFEMILNKMIEARISKLNDMERMIESVPSQFEHLARELKGKSSLVIKEIETLKEQIKLANEEKGWISPAINNYKTGFLQGKQLAINYKF